MRTELPVVSFLCMGLLVGLSPVFLHTRNVAVISLATWLICCNLVHGIDAVLWAGNEAVHVPVWCDIVTRVLLASQLALPGCALTLSRNLRRCAVGQEVVQKAYTTMQDLTFCLIIPIVYIILHVIVQPHRFDIAEDFGCSASVYTSTVSIILIWIPPLIVCIITLAFAIFAIRSRLDSGLVFFSHMQDSPRLNVFTFLRPLFISVPISLITFSTTVYSMYARISAIGGLQTWSIETWNGVHAQMSQIFIVPSTPHIDLVRTEVEWWVVPACSLLLVCITAAGLVCRASADGLGGYRDLSRWFRSTVLRQPLSDLHVYSSKRFRSRILSSVPSTPTLVGDAKSFKEDAWHVPAPARVKLAPLTIPERPPSTFRSCVSPEDPFVQSTLHYIESPTGREALGLPPFPPALQPATQQRADPSPEAASMASITTSPTNAPRPNSILSAPWPRPPSTVPSTPRTPSPKGNAAQITVQPPSPVFTQAPTSSRPPSVTSFTTSLASSTISYGSFYDDTAPHAVPFQDHLSDLGAGPGLMVPKLPQIRRMRSRDVLLPRSLSSSRGRRNPSDALSGGIYMTVVKETV